MFLSNNVAPNSIRPMPKLNLQGTVSLERYACLDPRWEVPKRTTRKPGHSWTNIFVNCLSKLIYGQKFRMLKNLRMWQFEKNAVDSLYKGLTAGRIVCPRNFGSCIFSLRELRLPNCIWNLENIHLQIDISQSWRDITCIKYDETIQMFIFVSLMDER